MAGGVVNKYTSEVLKTMTDVETLAAIEKDIHADAYAKQAANPVRYSGKNLAESIETALYLCPLCMGIGTIRSKGDRFSCACGLDAKYLETGFLDGAALPFTTITGWDEWQARQLAEIIDKAGAGPICSDDNRRLFEVKVASGKTLIGEGALQISREILRCAGKEFPIAQITRIVVAGQSILLFAMKSGTTYEVRSASAPHGSQVFCATRQSKRQSNAAQKDGSPFCALKYREIFRILSRRDD